MHFTCEKYLAIELFLFFWKDIYWSIVEMLRKYSQQNNVFGI